MRTALFHAGMICLPLGILVLGGAIDRGARRLRCRRAVRAALGRYRPAVTQGDA